MNQRHDLQTPEGRAADLDARLDVAMRQIETGLDALVTSGDRGEVMGLDSDRLIAFARRIEAHRARLTLVDSFIVEAADLDDLVSRSRGRSLAGALADVLRISPGEAKSRVRRADAIRPRNEFSSGIAPARHPALADAVRAGDVTTCQADAICRALDTFDRAPDLDHTDVAAAEQALVEHAAAFGPGDLAVIARKIDDALRPDGILSDPAVAAAHRGIEIGPLRRDGTHSIAGSITRILAAKLHAVLTPLAAPQPTGGTGTGDERGNTHDGADTDAGASHAAVGRDLRTAPQRLHDALEDVADRLLRTGTLPASGGTPATVHILINIDQLRRALAHHANGAGNAGGTGNPGGIGGTGCTVSAGSTRALGTLGDTEHLTLTEVLALGAEADLIPTYLTDTGGITAYGREKRIATASQTNALIARDKGCSFPTCDAPPEWCQRHHITDWAHGGETNLDNLTLLCGYHHREFATRGWTVAMTDGVPTWTPPRYLDRTQRPQTNTRIKLTPGHTGVQPRSRGEPVSTLSSSRTAPP